MNKSMKSVGEGTKTRVNINIFLSQDVLDDGISDNEGKDPCHAESHVVSLKFKFKTSCTSLIKKVLKQIWWFFFMCDKNEKVLIFTRF